MSDKSLSLEVRSVTDADVETFVANGWVKFPRLISQTEAAALLDRAMRLMGQHGTGGVDVRFRATST